MNEENHWDHNVEGDAVECSVFYVGMEEMQQTLNENRKSHRYIRSITRVYCC